MLIDINFIKKIFKTILFFSFLLKTLLLILTHTSAGFNRVTSAIWPD